MRSACAPPAGPLRPLLPVLLLLAAAGAGGCDEPLAGEGYPLATFICDSHLEVGVPATFDARASRDRGLIERFTFHFGDGSPVFVSRSPVVTHTYRKAGSYKVELEVIDDLGNVAFERRTVQVVPRGQVPACSGSCPGHLECVMARCRFTPAECRSEDLQYGCDPGLVCCQGYCEKSCAG